MQRICRIVINVKASVIHLQQFQSDRAIGTPVASLNDVQVDGYASDAEAGPIARVDTIDLVGVVNSGLKTWRDARPCRYVAAEAALLQIGSRVSATGLNNSRHTHTTVP